MAKTAPDAEDDTPLVNEEIDNILERWQRFADQGGEDLFYGERFMVNPPDPKKGEKRLLKVFGSRNIGSEHPFDTMTSMRSVDGAIPANVLIWED